MTFDNPLDRPEWKERHAQSFSHGDDPIFENAIRPVMLELMRLSQEINKLRDELAKRNIPK